ncbi:MAG: O-antigen ligase family protein [Acidimicrobiales bacterium]
MRLRPLPQSGLTAVAIVLTITMTAGRWGGLTTSLSLLAFAWCLLIITLLILRPRPVDLDVFRHPALGLGVGAFTVLPLIGVLAGRGSLSSAAAFGVGLSLVAAYAMGQYLAADRFDISTSLLVILGANLLFVLSQIAAFNGFPVLNQLNAFDLDSKFGAGYFIVARPSGLFLNPNDLGSFAAVILCYSMVVHLRQRMTTIALSSILVLASGSRGALLAVGVIMAWLVGRRYFSTTGQLLRLGRIAAMVGVAIALLLAFGPDVLIERLQFRGGVAADSSVSGRFDQLADLWDWMLTYPLGYWSPPQLLSGTAIDNDWTRVLVQGGPLLLLLWAAGLVVLGTYLRNVGPAMAAPAIAVAVLSFSQLTVGRPTGLLFFFLVGYHHRLTLVAALQRSQRHISIGADRRSTFAHGRRPQVVHHG